jgi:hypothetical protein
MLKMESLASLGRRTALSLERGRDPAGKRQRLGGGALPGALPGWTRVACVLPLMAQR